MRAERVNVTEYQTIPTTYSRMRRSVLTCACVAYCTVFFVHPPTALSQESKRIWRWPASRVESVIGIGLSRLGHPKPTPELRFAAYSLVMGGAIPLLATTALKRRPRDMGLRLPNVLGYRLTLLGVVVAFPFLVWMAKSQSIGANYVRQYREFGYGWFAAYYLTLMVAEHWLLQGVVLGWCRRGCRWPERVGTEVPSGSRMRRMLNWLGLAQEDNGFSGGSAVLRWLGIPRDCLLPMLLSGMLFGMVHIGKDARELLLSFPGGLAQAYLAYRTNSWLTPMVQHALTAWIAFMFMNA